MASQHPRLSRVSLRNPQAPTRGQPPSTGRREVLWRPERGDKVQPPSLVSCLDDSRAPKYPALACNFAGGPMAGGGVANGPVLRTPVIECHSSKGLCGT